MILKGGKLIEEFEDEYEIHYAPRENSILFSDEEQEPVPEKKEGIFWKILVWKIIIFPFTIVGYLLTESEGDKRRRIMNNIRDIMSHLDIYSTSDLEGNYCEFSWSDVLVCPILDGSHDLSSSQLKDYGYTEEEIEEMDLLKIDFRSPPWTWASLCGTAGILYICKKRKAQIYFLQTMMN